MCFIGGDLLRESSQEKGREGSRIWQGKEAKKDVDSTEEQLALSHGELSCINHT